MAAVVVDDVGEIICAKRMDRARPTNNYMALRKARSSIESRQDTTAVRLFLEERGLDLRDFGPDLTRVPGGKALVNLGGEDASPPIVYGAIGTSGRRAEEDEALATIGQQALLKAIGSK